MLLDDNDRFALARRQRYLWAAFKRPHRVLSTCRVNGGLREDLTHIANHQSCEGVGHGARQRAALGLAGADYHRHACEDAGLPPASTALMGTAANMQCAVRAEASYRELSVTLVATAGVLGNATRAGDPAGWHEQRDGSHPLDAPAFAPPAEPAMEPSPDETGEGTIVTLVFINQPCTGAALVRAATLVTEAKSTALLDLRMPSLFSSGLATGTGTDQLAIAAPLAREACDWERHWAGAHNTLGELLARATREAVRDCLLLQNGLCPALRRSITAALARHGCTEQALRQCAEHALDSETARLFRDNLQAIVHDPRSAAAAYALAETVDLGRVGILHPGVAHEALLDQAALLAAVVALAPEHTADFRARLAAAPERAPAELAALAVVWGFARKWN